MCSEMSLLTIRCKLQPSTSDTVSFERTVQAFADACNDVLKVARAKETFSKYTLQKLCYEHISETYGLSANRGELTAALAIRALARVGKRKGRSSGGFKATSVDYDQRILSVDVKREVVSLSTVDGRLKVPMHIGNYQRHLLRTAESIQGGQLVKGKREWYIHLQCKFAEETPQPTKGFLGVDLGIVNLATTSDGDTHSGEAVEKVRQRYSKHRSSLQKKGTKSAKRRLKKIAGNEARFRKDQNHKIAKSVVDTAKRTERGIKLEDLSGIREGTRVRRKDRAKHSGWSFFQLREFIEYRCVRDGVPLALIEARNTSRTCHQCQHCEKANRKSQAEFKCLQCDYSAHADYNASQNIAGADVLQPIVWWVEANPVHDVPHVQAHAL
jgi:putative transposase